MDMDMDTKMKIDRTTDIDAEIAALAAEATGLKPAISDLVDHYACDNDDVDTMCETVGNVVRLAKGIERRRRRQGLDVHALSSARAAAAYMISACRNSIVPSGPYYLGCLGEYLIDQINVEVNRWHLVAIS